MQQMKCKCVITASFFFEKLGISFPFWSVLYILSETRLQNDIWKTLFRRPSSV